MPIHCAHCSHVDRNQQDHLRHMKDRHFGAATLRHTCGICQTPLRQTSYLRHFQFNHQQLIPTRPTSIPPHVRRPPVFPRAIYAYPLPAQTVRPQTAGQPEGSQSSSSSSVASSSQTTVAINYISVFDKIKDLQMQFEKQCYYFLSKPKITAKLVAEIVDQQVATIRSCMNIIKDTVPSADYDNINMEMEEFLKVRQSQYLRMELLKKNPYYLAPYSYNFGYRSQEADGTLINKSSNVAVVEIEKTLRMLFSNRKLCDSLVFPSMFYDHADYDHPFCGSHTKRIYDELNKQDCIFIQLFMDEFCPVNPLGGATKRNKIMGFYFKILNLPSDLQVLDTVFLVALPFASDVKKSALQLLLQKLIVPQFVKLYSGIPVYHKGVIRNMPVVLHSIVGDNEGIHKLQDLVVSFRGTSPCRFCTVIFDNLKFTYTVAGDNLKTYESYEAAIATNNENIMKEQGINNICALNVLPHFHFMWSQCCDIMHDLPEGHLRRLMASVINSLIFDEQIELDRINIAITTFAFRGTMRNNRPNPIVKEHVIAGEVKGQTASQMINLVTMLPLILKVNQITVSSDNPWWTTYRAFLTIWNMLMMPKITEAQIDYLQILIGRYLQAFHLNGGHFTVKPHYMLHYPAIIRLFGPLFYHWCMRYEGKHKEFKDFAKVNSNFTNLTMTLANRHQVMMVPAFSDMADDNYKDLHFKQIARREYKKDLVVVYGHNQEENKPNLGLIVATDFENLILSLECLKIIRYTNEVFAYIVEKTSTLIQVPMKSLLHYKSAALYSDFVRYPYDLQ